MVYVKLEVFERVICMKLFEKDSAYDLALRGFSQEYILNKTGFDVGYHNSKIKFDIKDIVI